MISTTRKKRHTLLLIWIIPLVALLLAANMLYKEYTKRGVTVKIVFDDASGFLEEKTLLKYRGIKVGSVKAIEMDPESRKKFIVTAMIDKDKAPLIAKEGTHFWRVGPKVSLNEVSGLSTILSGEYIEVLPAFDNDAKAKTRFIADREPAFLKRGGRYFTLISQNGNLPLKTPIVHKGITVGEVLQKKLVKDTIHYRIYVEKQFQHLITEDSKFWKLSPFELKLSLAGLQLSSQPLVNMLTGAVGVSTGSDGAAAKEQRFKLYASKEQIDLHPKTITLLAPESYGLSKEFGKVYFKGVEAGKVLDSEYDPATRQSRIQVGIKKRYRSLLRHSPHFHVVKPSLDFQGAKGLDALAQGAYISFSLRGDQTAIKDSYPLHTAPASQKGVHFTLTAKRSGGLHAGSKIFYKDVAVGVVDDVTLHKKRVEFSVTVFEKYAHLLNESSLFFIKKALEVEASLRKVRVNVAPMEQMVANSISFITPKKSKGRKANYPLYPSYTKLHGKSPGDALFITLRADRLENLKKGTPILYKGLRCGEVTGYEYDKAKDGVAVFAYVKKDFAHKINASTRFFIKKGVDMELSLSGLKLKTDSLEELAYGAISFETPAPNAPKQTAFTLTDPETERANRYTPLTLSMEDKSGIVENSPVIYRGMQIGYVEKLRLKQKRLQASLQIQKRYEKLFQTDTLIWAEQFSADLVQGVQNIQTAVTGSALHVKPGNSGILVQSLTLRSEKLPPSINKKGLRITLKSDMRSSLKIGAPIYYRQVKIGNVERYDLCETGECVRIECFIRPKYAKFVRQNSKFYLSTAIGVDFNLFELKITTGTFETLLQGTISMATPQEYGKKAQEGAEFFMYASAEDEWLSWQPVIKDDENGSI